MSRRILPLLSASRAGQQKSETLNVTQKIVLLLLLACVATLPLWLGLERAYSAPATLAPATPSPSPSITIDLPDETLIGEDFFIDVTFKNNPGGSVGFGPYVALYFPAKGADGNSLGHKCDGISFLSAEALFTTPASVPLPASYDSALDTAAGNLHCPRPYTLPFAGMTAVGAAPSGDYQLVVLELPFGSFDATQPTQPIKVKVHLSDYADRVTSTAGTPLTVYAQGGFRYGADALDNHPNDPLIESSVVSDTTKPTVFKLTKSANAPEDETVTGPNFLRKYTVIADIADTQKIDNLVVHDFLHNNVQYQGQVNVKIGTNTAVVGASCGSSIDYRITKQPPTTNAANSPNNELEISFCHAITGTNAAADITITFAFFIPEFDANGATVLPTNCKPATSINDVKAEGDWTPSDPRDQPMVHIVSDLTLQDHILQDKCLAIQKSVGLAIDTNAPGLTPGDTLQYQLSFQGSDYKTLTGLVVNDMLSNGQKLVPGSVTLTISDQFGSRSGVIPPAFITQAADPAGASKFCSVKLQTPPSGTVLTFNVSGAMAAIPGTAAPRLIAGIWTGGYAAGSTSPHNPALGTITFRVQVLDVFQYAVTPGDKFVDKEDPMNNCVAINAKVLQNKPRPTPINLPVNIPNTVVAGAFDNSATAVKLIGDTLRKTVYSVKRANAVGVFSPACGPGSSGSCSNFPLAPQEVRAGDQVTYQIEKTLPSTDAENLIIEDWLPQPFYAVTGINFSNTPCVGVPGPGNACLGIGDTLHSLPISPTVTANAATNSISFNYGTFNDTANQSRKIVLWFTYTVTNLPHADALFMTNEVRECETNTFGAKFCQVSIAQVNVRQPRLKIWKGVVASSNPNAVFSPATPFPSGSVFNLGGFASGTVSSGNAPNSNVSNVDANDTVTFAVTIENVGGAPAYDVAIKDLIPKDSFGNPSCFTIVPGTIQVKRGLTATVVLPGFYSISPPVPTTTDFTITSTPLLPIPIAAYHPTSGANIVVITFQAKLLANIKPGCCKNRIELQHYSSTLNGPDFVTAGLTPPFFDEAEVCVRPLPTKSLVATSEPHTMPLSSLTIGEVARFRLLTVLPEGGSTVAFQVVDALPPGLKFIDPNSARIAFISNSGITRAASLTPPGYSQSGNTPLSSAALFTKSMIPSGVITSSGSCGGPVTFNLGNVQNLDNDNDLEYIQIEFNAVVCNVSTNQNGVALTNTFSVLSHGNNLATSNPVVVNVVEPNLTITKAVSPTTVLQGGTAQYTVTVTNPGPLTAFDVQFTDMLPSGMTFVNSSTAVSGSCLPTPGTTSTSPAVTCANIPVNGVVTIKYKAVANTPACPATLTNRAAVTWTSLPGNGTPIGASNATGSITPGASGAVDGERNGTTPLLTLNDYRAAASATLTVTCPSSNCATPPAGMVAWWPLDETSGNTLHSIVGNHDGVTQPGAIGAGGVSVAPSPKVGSALFFGAAKATVPDDSALNFGTGDFSIDAWVRSFQPGLLSAVVDKLDVTGRRGYSFFVQNGRVQLVMANGTTSSTFQSSNTFVANGTWRHVAVTVRRTTGSPVGQFFIDGVPAGPTFTPLPGDINSNATLLIGSYRMSTSACSCEVALDEIELFNTAVPAADIYAIFKADKNGKCRAQISGSKFNDLNGNGIRDSGEPGLPGWTIKATDSLGNVQVAITDAAGNYTLVVPAPASYTVSEGMQAGWIQSAPSSGTYSVAVTANQVVNNRDFGNRKHPGDAKCDLQISKKVDPNPVVSGQPVYVNIVVTNVGTGPCHGPTYVSESMPPELALVSASVASGSCNLATGLCTYPPFIPAGGTVVFKYVFQVNAKPGTIFKNCASLKNSEDTNAANDQDCVKVKTVGDSSPVETTLPIKTRDRLRRP